MTIDLHTSLPMSRSLQAARARGYEARLEGVSRYANPYAEEAQRRVDAKEPLGWLGSYLAEWWRGWNAADSQVRS